ncbi:MAG: alpha/beta hydrolase fold domain-containing protein [Vulcanimicrobiota bacterium]
MIASSHMAFWACIAGALLAMGVMTDSVQASSIPGADMTCDILYGRAGDENLYLDLYTPQGIQKPAPLAVWIHGGGWVQGSRSQLGPGADELISRGFIVASLDYRLAPKHPWPAQFDDVRRAIDFLCSNADHYNIDADRIGVWGGSAGAHLASLLALVGIQNDGAAPVRRVKAVVDFCGPSDLLSLDFPEPLQRMLEAVFPPGDRQKEMLKEASPVEYVTADAPPFLIIHGEYDNLVPPAQAQLFYTRLLKAGVPAELIIVKNAGHGFQPVNGKPGLTRTQMGHLVVEFFEKNLQSVKDLPGKEPLRPGASNRQ